MPAKPCGKRGSLAWEYGQTQNRLEKAGHALEALGSGAHGATGGPTENDVREALQKLNPLWDELFPAEKERLVRLLVGEVILSRDGLLIRLRLHGLNSRVAELQGDGPAGAVGPVRSDGPPGWARTARSCFAAKRRFAE